VSTRTRTTITLHIITHFLKKHTRYKMTENNVCRWPIRRQCKAQACYGYILVFTLPFLNTSKSQHNSSQFEEGLSLETFNKFQGLLHQWSHTGLCLGNWKNNTKNSIWQLFNDTAIAFWFFPMNREWKDYGEQLMVYINIWSHHAVWVTEEKRTTLQSKQWVPAIQLTRCHGVVVRNLTK
jgi:hypothetical protein